MEVVYYWYHHMMNSRTRKEIQRCIDSKDFKGFMKWRGRLNRANRDCPFDIEYLPDTALAYSGDDDGVELIDILNQENFSKITFSESECG